MNCMSWIKGGATEQYAVFFSNQTEPELERSINMGLKSNKKKQNIRSKAFLNQDVEAASLYLVNL